METIVNSNSWINRFTCFMLGVSKYYFHDTDICFFTRCFIKAFLVFAFRTFLVLMFVAGFILISHIVGTMINQHFELVPSNTFFDHTLITLLGLLSCLLCTASLVGVISLFFCSVEKIKYWWDSRIESHNTNKEPSTLSKMVHAWKHKYCSKVKIK